VVGAQAPPAESPAALYGDLNGDGTVGIADLTAVADNYGKAAGGSE
jgi:hypothetical protein